MFSTFQKLILHIIIVHNLIKIILLFIQTSRVLNQTSESILQQKKQKEETSFSIFHPQQTLKIKNESKINQGELSQYTYNELDKPESGELTARNTIKRMNSGRHNILSEYLDRIKPGQKKNLYQSSLNELKSDVPFRVKYFLQDQASQIYKESKQNQNLNDGLSVVFVKIINICKIITFQNLRKAIKSQIINIWLNKLPILHPYSTLKLVWDSWIALLTTFLFFIYSLRIFFQNNSIGDVFDIYQYVFVNLGLFFWIADIFIELNTSILYRGELIKDKKYIAKQFLKNRLIFDIVGIIPIVEAVFHPHGQERYFDFLILLKLKHFSYTLSRIDYYLSYQQDKKNMMDLVKLIFLIVLTTHFIALLWYRLAVFEKEVIGYNFTWLDNIKLKSSTFMEQYWQSFYFATVTIYTVGYGDITPVTLIECNFVTLTILVTGIIFAYAINQIGLIMHNINSAQTVLKDDLQVLNKQNTLICLYLLNKQVY